MMLRQVKKSFLEPSSAMGLERKALNWIGQHTVLRCDEAPPLPKKTPTLSRCLQSGTCVCTDAGKQRDQLCSSVCGWLKDFGATSAEAKSSLNNGGIVVSIHDLLNADGDKPPSFYHVALYFQRPVRPTFLRLQNAKLLPGGQVMLECAGGERPWATLRCAMSSLDLAHAHNMRVWRAVVGPSPHAPRAFLPIG